jgi:DNA-binding XRE family transcriptional regulator
MKVVNHEPAINENAIHWHLALVKLDWSRRDLAERLGITRQTVYDWRDEAPRYALAYLEAMLMLKKCGEYVR